MNAEITTKINVLAVDDHSMLLAGLVKVLGSISFTGDIYTAQNAKECLDIMRTKKCPVVLMDYRMEGMNGAECTHEIMKLYPKTKVIGLSMYTDTYHLMEMVNAGACGYLTKNTDIDEIEKAISSVVSEKRYFCKSMEPLLFDMTADKLKMLETEERTFLSVVEKDVLKLIYEDYTTKEIADRMNKSARTVEGIKSKLYKKTNTNTLAGLVKQALKLGIVGDL